MLLILIKNLPFAGLIFINAFSAANNAGGPMLKPVLLVVCAGLIVNLLVAVRLSHYKISAELSAAENGCRYHSVYINW